MKYDFNKLCPSFSNKNEIYHKCFVRFHGSRFSPASKFAPNILHSAHLYTVVHNTQRIFRGKGKVPRPIYFNKACRTFNEQDSTSAREPKRQPRKQRRQTLSTKLDASQRMKRSMSTMEATVVNLDCVPVCPHDGLTAVAAGLEAVRQKTAGHYSMVANLRRSLSQIDGPLLCPQS